MAKEPKAKEHSKKSKAKEYTKTCLEDSTKQIKHQYKKMRRYICLFLFIDILLLISNLLQYQIFGIKKAPLPIIRSGAFVCY